VTSPDGKFLYSAGEHDDQSDVAVFAIRDDGTLHFVEAAPRSSWDGSLASAADGRRLYAGLDGPSVLDRDPETGRLTEIASGRSWVSGGWDGQLPGLVVSADGHGIYATGRDGFTTAVSAIPFDGSSLGDPTVYREFDGGISGIRHTRSLGLSPDGRFLYVTGRDSGQYGPGPGTVAVFARDPGTQRLHFRSLFKGPHFDGGLPPLSVTIDDGAEYTNSPNVALTIQGLTGLQAHWTGIVTKVANDASLHHALKLYPDEDGAPASGHQLWRLATGGPDALPRTVYVDGLDPATGAEVVVSDDIVLDQRRPSVLGARARLPRRRHRAARVSIRARDTLSGVAAVQVARSRARAAVAARPWHRWHRGRRYAAPRARAWVRVRDRAGNVSHWRHVRMSRRHG
jgi:hypothetical protein